MEALTRPSPPTAAEMPINAKANAKGDNARRPTYTSGPNYRDVFVVVVLM